MLKEKEMKWERFASSVDWPDLALVVLVVSVKSGPFGVCGPQQKVTVKIAQFLLHKKRRLKKLSVRKFKGDPLTSFMLNHS